MQVNISLFQYQNNNFQLIFGDKKFNKYFVLYSIIILVDMISVLQFYRLQIGIFSVIRYQNIEI